MRHRKEIINHNIEEQWAKEHIAQNACNTRKMTEEEKVKYGLKEKETLKNTNYKSKASTPKVKDMTNNTPTLSPQEALLAIEKETMQKHQAVSDEILDVKARLETLEYEKHKIETALNALRVAKENIA